MRKNKVGAIAIKSFALLVVLGTLGTANQAMAQDPATPYRNMAPIDQYLMTDQGAEIALARSAAPESISRDAEVLVLGRHGFETAVKGMNGFVCIVGRSWTSAADADYWDPKVRVPMCFNAAAARSYLLRLTKETEWGLAGRTPAQMTESIAAAIAQKNSRRWNPELCATCCRSKATAATARPAGLPTSCFSIRIPTLQFGERICRVPLSLV
jgi:hypothetical protein